MVLALKEKQTLPKLFLDRISRMSHLWIIFLGIVCFDITTSQTSPYGFDFEISINQTQCEDIRIQERLDCGYDSITSEVCEQRGCCYDENYRLCYFPKNCDLVLTAAGGYSAFLMLPGFEESARGSANMLEGGNWCARKVPMSSDIEMNIDLRELKLVYLSISGGRQDSQVDGFNISYSRGKEQKFLDTDDPFPNSYDWNKLFIFAGSDVRMRPVPNKYNPCKKIQIIKCPAPDFFVIPTQAPTTPLPTKPKPNITEPPPRVLAVKKEPEEEFKESDKRPSAIVIGSTGLIFMVSMLVFLVLLDLPTLILHMIMLWHNLWFIHPFFSYIASLCKKCKCSNRCSGRDRHKDQINKRKHNGYQNDYEDRGSSVPLMYQSRKNKSKRRNKSIEMPYIDDTRYGDLYSRHRESLKGTSPSTSDNEHDIIAELDLHQAWQQQQSQNKNKGKKLPNKKAYQKTSTTEPKELTSITTCM